MHIRTLTPSMSSLVAFEAAARHGSFTRAGAELFLTQSAVSRQVQALEALLNAQLFERSGKQIRLTEAGVRYAEDIAGALARIRSASLRVQDSRSSAMTLQLAVLPILGSKWLLPRLGRFHDRHPDVLLHVHTKTGDFDLLHSGLDACLTMGDGHWPLAVRHHLFDARPLVVGSPALLARQPVHRVEDLLQHALLHITAYSSGWKEHLLASGIDPRNIRLGARFEYTAHLIQAVVSGMGLGLVSDIYLGEELRNGSLVAPTIQGWQHGSKSYYLLYPPGSEDKPALQLFRHWLMEEAAAFAAQPAASP